MEEFLEPSKITEGHKGGLARMYADNDFRDYINHAINIANHNVLSSLRINKPDLAREFTIRLDCLKQLLELGKKVYSQAEKLKSTPLEELTK